MIRTQPRSPIEPVVGYPGDAIPAVCALLDDLHRVGIRHCLWKSNEHLAEALAGRTDVDILVDEDRISDFRELLRRHGVKRLVPPPRGAFPGMEHYLGCDRDSGRLYHLHVHERLVLGERFVKNYRVPLEREFLASTRRLQGVEVPSPELELGVLAARTLLKYRPRDAVKDVLGIRTPGVPDPTRAELDWLVPQTTVERVRSAMRSSGGFIPPKIASTFLDAFERDPRSGATFLRLRGQLRSALRGHQRRGRTYATAEYIATAWSRRRRLRRRPADVRMQPIGGGTTIALIGADGAGKSTIAAELSTWLGWKLQVRSYYLGSKEPSAASRWSYLAFRGFRRGHRAVTATIGSRSMLATPLAAARDTALALHHLTNGRDRLRRFERGRRDARAGRIVIFDRFPMGAVSSTREHRLLDGPQVTDLIDRRRGIPGWLGSIEERMYLRFELPDHLVVLEVSPDRSLDRKPDHRPEVLEAKSRAVTELAEIVQRTAQGPHVIRVDADRPLRDVVLDVETGLWDVL